MLSLKGGIPLSEATVSHAKGTEIIVKNLFFNTPARLQNMSSPNVELSYITDFVSKMAIANPNISFTLSNNGKELIRTSGNGNLHEVISEIYSTGTAREMVQFFDDNGMFKVEGYTSKISITKSSKNNIILVLNGRLVHNKGIINSVVEGYGNLLMAGKYPISIVNIKVDLGMVDVNVHPTKYEVRLSDEATLKEMITTIINKTLSHTDLTVDVNYEAHSEGISDYYLEESNENPVKSELNVQPSIIQNENITKEDAINNLDNVIASLEEEKELDLEDDELEESNDLEDELNDSQDESYEEDESYDFDEEDLKNLEEVSNYSYQNENNEVISDEELNSLGDWDLFTQSFEEEKIIEYQNDEVNNEIEEQEEIVKEKPVQMQYTFNEDEVTHDNDNSRLSKMYYIGQLFGTYILAQDENTFYLIDQHAANERVNYEKIYNDLKKKETASYDLLVPFSLEFTPSEILLINEKMDKINKIGIILEEFGQNTFIVRSIPIWIFRGKEKEFVEEIINKIIHSQNDKDYNQVDFLDSLAKSLACKKSIKGNEFHTALEIEYLLDELAKTSNPFTCPHGRPVIIKLSREDVEKWFKRIV